MVVRPPHSYERFTQTPKILLPHRVGSALRLTDTLNIVFQTFDQYLDLGTVQFHRWSPLQGKAERWGLTAVHPNSV